MRTYNEIRLASIAAARSKIDRREYLQSCEPGERNNAALIFDRCREYDHDIKNPPAWNENDIFQAQADLHKINTIQAIYENDGCGYRDLAYRVQIGARISAGAERELSKLHISIPSREDALAFLNKSWNRNLNFHRDRYGLEDNNVK